MDEASEGALRARIRAQGWEQGCLLEMRTDLFLADLRTPLTPEAAAVAAKHGAEPRGVVHFDHDPPEAMIIVSQRCDLVAALDDEPLCEAIPLLTIPAGAPLPRPNTVRRFLVDADKGLVADQSRRLCFEKTLLPDREATQLLHSREQKQSFRAWCARRPARVPLPDDFNQTVGSALSGALASALGRRPEAEAIFTWRAAQDEVDEEHVDVALLVPYDETHAAAAGVPDWAKEVEARLLERLPAAHARARTQLASVREHRLIGVVAKPAEDVSMRELINFPALMLEHLTYKGAEVRGAEPHEEEIG